MPNEIIDFHKAFQVEGFIFTLYQTYGLTAFSFFLNDSILLYSTLTFLEIFPSSVLLCASNNQPGLCDAISIF
jgi:hypothetical protein